MALDHQIKAFAPFVRGVDLYQTETLLDQGFAKKAINCRFDRGTVKARRGYARRGRHGTTLALTGKTYDHTGNGNGENIVSGATNDFQYVQLGDTFTLTGTNITTGTYTVSSIDTTNYSWACFSDIVATGDNADTTVDGEVSKEVSATPLQTDEGDVIGLIDFWGSDGNLKELMFTQKSVYEYQYSDGVANYLTGGTDLFAGGAEWIRHTLAPITPGSVIGPTLVFTDGGVSGGTYPLWSWQSGSIAEVTLDDTTDAFEAVPTNVRQVAWFGDHLLVGDYSASGKRYRKTVCWGDLNVCGIEDGGIDNGAYILGDAEGKMQRFIRLGAALAIYFSDAIVVCTRVSTDDIYSFDTRVHGTGLVGPQAIVAVRGVHYFIGSDNVYYYDGGVVPVPIGDRVSDAIFSMLNPDAVDRIVAQHLPRRNLIQWFIPREGNPKADAVFSYNYKDQTWTGPGVVANKITASGFGDRTISYGCDDDIFAGVTCQDLIESCSDYLSMAGFRVPTVGSESGEVFDWTELHLTDNGDPIYALMETGSAVLGEEYGAFGTVSWIYIESRGSTFELHWSTDFGRTWSGQSGLTLGGHTDFEHDLIPVTIQDRFLKFRITFRADVGSPEIRILSIRYKPSSVRDMN